MSNQEPGRVEPLQPYQLGLDKAFELLRDAVVVDDAGTGRIVFWNPAAEAIFGYKLLEPTAFAPDAIRADASAARSAAAQPPIR